MITIKEIIALCKAKQLKNCNFFSDDSANECIWVDENSVPWFGNKEHKRENILEVNENHLFEIDNEMNYFFESRFDEYREDLLNHFTVDGPQIGE